MILSKQFTRKVIALLLVIIMLVSSVPAISLTTDATASKITTNTELARRALDVAKNYKTLYVMGCFGAPMTAANKTRYINAHSFNAKETWKGYINAASSDTFGFDCVCLVKGLLWGWDGSLNAIYGGAQYTSNGVPDIGTEGMIGVCSGVSTDFSNIAVGELCWMQGHVGIYVGDGLTVECTANWTHNVLISACNRKITGYNTRTWTKHGKLPYISYVTEDETAPDSEQQTFEASSSAVNAYYKLADGKTSAVVRKSPHNAGEIVGDLLPGVLLNITKKGTNSKGSLWYYIGEGDFAGNYIFSGNITPCNVNASFTTSIQNVTSESAQVKSRIDFTDASVKYATKMGVNLFDASGNSLGEVYSADLKSLTGSETYIDNSDAYYPINYTLSEGTSYSYSVYVEVAGKMFTSAKVPFTTETTHHEHIWDKGSVTKEATCIEQGIMTYSCTICDEQYTETIELASHTPTVDKAVPAGCETPGYTEGSHCSVCNEILSEQEEIPSLGHEYKYGTVTKEATCTEEGVMTYTCTRCHETLDDAIEMLPHYVVTDEAVPATCVLPGLTQGSHCSKCNTIIVPQMEVAALGHKFVRGKCTVCFEPDPDAVFDIKGDLDHSGKVTAADLVILKRIIVGVESSITEADIDGSGKINANDIIALKNIILGFDS